MRCKPAGENPRGQVAQHDPLRDSHDSARIQHLEKCRRLTSDLRGLDRLWQTGPEAENNGLLRQLVRRGGQQPFRSADIDA